MKGWSSLLQGLSLTVRTPRLWLVFLLGNVVIAGAFALWLPLGVANWWELLGNFLLMVLMVALTLVLYGGTMNYYLAAHQDRSAPMLPAFTRAFKHHHALVVWMVIAYFLCSVLTQLNESQDVLANYLRSEMPAWLRRSITNDNLVSVYTTTLATLKWVVLPGLFLPLVLGSADQGFRGMFNLHRKRIVRDWGYWITLVIASLLGVYTAGAILGWKLDPQTATLSAEKTHLAFRIALIYVLGSFSWLLTCSVLGRVSVPVSGDGKPVA
jgi:hypothetical protein